MQPLPRPQPDRGPAPSWPMLPRRAEQLLLTVWHLQQKNGWCYASQDYLAECIGIKARQVRNLINQCHREGCLQIKGRHGQTLLLRAVLGKSQPRQFVAAPPRQSIAGDPGNSLPPILIQYSPKEIPGNSAQDAPLFVPKAVNLWEACQRLKTATLCEALKESFKRGEIGKVKFRGRTWAITAIHLSTPSFCQCILPTGNGDNAHTIAWHDEDLTRLEFYP